jgi:hypothetical protein
MLASSAATLPEGASNGRTRSNGTGYRTLALKDGSRVKPLSRNLKDAKRLFTGVQWVQ